jgi:hypothetical protein
MEPWMMDPRVLLVGVSALDAVLVAALCWTVSRLRKERTTAQAEQRETLERLRTDLAGLVVDADARSRALDGQLEVRETRLRSLLHEISGTETWALDARRTRPAEKPGARGAARDALGRTDEDPAEARLRRDLRKVLAQRGA